MMAQTKKIIKMIKVDKLNSFLALWYLIKEIENMLDPCFYPVIGTLMKDWVKSKKL